MFSMKLMTVSYHLFKQCLNTHKILCQSRYLTSFSYLRSQESNQNLVIDLSFEDLMTSEECHRLAIDLYAIHSINSFGPKEDQFRINVCHELPKNSLIIEYLSHYLPNLDNFHIHYESYLNLFDSRKLVYLSPDSRDLIEFNSNDVYIIGGIVQKKIFQRESNRITYLKAKSENIRVGRFPIDHLINTDMKRGIVLFVPQVFSILNDVKCGHSWEEAAHRNIPLWKLKPSVISQFSEDLVLRGKSLNIIK